jgi:hypothetical protein
MIEEGTILCTSFEGTSQAATQTFSKLLELAPGVCYHSKPPNLICGVFLEV